LIPLSSLPTDDPTKDPSGPPTPTTTDLTQPSRRRRRHEALPDEEPDHQPCTRPRRESIPDKSPLSDTDTPPADTPTILLPLPQHSHTPSPVPTSPLMSLSRPFRRRKRFETSLAELSSSPCKRTTRELHTEECATLHDESSPLLPSSPTSTPPPASPTLGTSRRAVLLATDIAGVPSFPDSEGALPASSYRSPPASPVIDMSAYDLPLPVSPVFPAPEIYSDISLPVSPSAAMPEDNPNPADLVSQPASTGPAQPACILFPIFDKRVYHS
jgi:hypothetical protein